MWFTFWGVWVPGLGSVLDSEGLQQYIAASFHLLSQMFTLKEWLGGVGKRLGYVSVLVPHHWWWLTLGSTVESRAMVLVTTKGNLTIASYEKGWRVDCVHREKDFYPHLDLEFSAMRGWDLISIFKRGEYTQANRALLLQISEGKLCPEGLL